MTERLTDQQVIDLKEKKWILVRGSQRVLEYEQAIADMQAEIIALANECLARGADLVRVESELGAAQGALQETEERAQKDKVEIERLEELLLTYEPEHRSG